VREFEPELALFAPEGDPDFWLRLIVEALPRLIEAEGRAFVELGWQQSERALELAREAGLQARLHDDLARIPRVIELGL
jgi:methylase of polypeptide subunit release factors